MQFATAWLFHANRRRDAQTLLKRAGFGAFARIIVAADATGTRFAHATVQWGRKCENVMNIRGPKTEGNTALQDDSNPVDLLPRRGMRTVPEKPTLDMLTSGSMAGGVSVETAWNIWQAMLKMVP